tara:strand:- start:180 stop:1160 length:981 start_codon:yes stop_codon:yes gene_type:complete
MLYYNCLKNYTNFKVDLPIDVAEFLGVPLRKAIAENASKENINRIYNKMEVDCASLFLENEIYVESYLKNKDVSESLKTQFIECFQTLNVKEVKHYNSIFVKPNFLDMFFKYLFPWIKRKFYLYTGASDYSIDDKYMKYIKNVKIIKWVGQNITLEHEKVIKIPIGLSTNVGENVELLNKLKRRRIKYDDKECKFLITHMEETSEKRENLHAYFEKKDWVTIAPKCDFETYMDHINKHRFVCCPRGNGIDTYRFWECIYMGCVPIVESSPLDDLYSKVNCIIVESFFDLKKEQLDNFKYNDDLLSKEALLLNSYDSNISSINLCKS